MTATIGDGATPVYEFDWEGGLTRTTRDLPDAQGVKTDAVETLAKLGREDPDCEVTLLGFDQ